MVRHQRPRGQRAVVAAPGVEVRPQAHLVGPVYLDLVFSGLSDEPRPGAEVRARKLGISPGGMANVAIALARLGVDVRLSAVFAEDSFGRYLVDTLTDEGVDLTWSRTLSSWNTPVTSSVAVGRERSMVTYEEPPPVPLASLVPEGQAVDCLVVSLAHTDQAWLSHAHEVAPLVCADVGGDEEMGGVAEVLARLTYLDVFMPNASEALALTDAEARGWDAVQAAEALSRSGPLTVVKLGAAGAVACGPGGAGPLTAPGVPVDAVDTTGAGDVFDAGYVYAALTGWGLEERLLFANLCASESVRLVGGSLSAPCWRDITAAWAELAHTELGHRYEFLRDTVGRARWGRDCRRSHPTLVGAWRPKGAPTI